MNQILKLVLVFICVLGSVITIVFYVTEFLLSDTYLHYLGEASVNKNTFCLYRDSGRDIRWLIYKFDAEDKVCSKISIGNINNDNLLLFNWDEGVIDKDAHIEIISNKYLVFMRGGLYHSLYDIIGNKVLFNINSIEDKIYSSLGVRLEGEELKKWTRENVHNKIKSIIDSNSNE